MDQIEALERLGRLRDSGILSEDEFQREKEKILSGAPSTATPPAPPPDPRDPASERPLDSFRGSTTDWLFGSLAGWGTLLLCLVFVGFVIILVRWLQNLSSRYDLTDQRLIVRTGLFMKHVDEIELYRVKDIRVDFSLLNQLVGIGTITLRSSDPTTGAHEFTMRDIPDAQQRREQIRTLSDRARQRRGVRELDVDPLSN